MRGRFEKENLRDTDLQEIANIEGAFLYGLIEAMIDQGVDLAESS
jgi:uncharacterized protein YjbI with pentapeptide repeats